VDDAPRLPRTTAAAKEDFMRRIVLLPIVLVACGGPPAGDDVEAKTAAVTGVSALPQGLVCGMAYQWDSSTRLVNFCAGKNTFQPPYSNGFEQQYVGDRGLAYGNGFYDQSYASVYAASPFDSANLILPKGAVCGFKRGCFDFTTTCMGINAAENCPFGWRMKVGSDLNAPAGCNYNWCEYQDPNSLCPNGNCLPSIPTGLVCGLTDNDAGTDPFRKGQCLGLDVNTQACPGGVMVRRGWYDWGRPSHHGLGWCETF
jgi:hypothetical protein